MATHRCWLMTRVIPCTFLFIIAVYKTWLGPWNQKRTKNNANQHTRPAQKLLSKNGALYITQSFLHETQGTSTTTVFNVHSNHLIPGDRICGNGRSSGGRESYIGNSYCVINKTRNRHWTKHRNVLSLSEPPARPPKYSMVFRWVGRLATLFRCLDTTSSRASHRERISINRKHFSFSTSANSRIAYRILQWIDGRQAINLNSMTLWLAQREFSPKDVGGSPIRLCSLF